MKGSAPSRFNGAAAAGQRLASAFPDRFAAREAVEPWRRWYKTSRWQRMRDSVLQRDAYTCRRCGGLECDTSCLVADHVLPHRGDAVLFWDNGNLQTLCVACHSSVKQAEERAAG